MPLITRTIFPIRCPSWPLQYDLQVNIRFTPRRCLPGIFAVNRTGTGINDNDKSNIETFPATLPQRAENGLIQPLFQPLDVKITRNPNHQVHTLEAQPPSLFKPGFKGGSRQLHFQLPQGRGPYFLSFQVRANVRFRGSITRATADCIRARFRRGFLTYFVRLPLKPANRPIRVNLGHTAWVNGDRGGTLGLTSVRCQLGSQQPPIPVVTHPCPNGNYH